MRIAPLIRLLPTLLILGLLIAVPGRAQAGKPTTDLINDAFSDVVCGIPVDVTVSGTATTHVQQVAIPDTGLGSDTQVYAVVKQRFTVTYVSQANGHVLTANVNRTLNDVAITSLGGGVWSDTFSYNGLAVRLRDGSTLLFQDRGRLVVTDTFYLGDLSTDADDYFISETLDSVSGPHPSFNNDAFFCSAFVAGMAS